MSLTHWKKFDNPDYLGAYSLLPNEEPIYTIKKITFDMVKSEGGKQEQCRIAHFHEDAKPMILNVTNCKIIASIYKTPYIENWIDKKIQVYATTTKYAGEVVECLRVRPILPKQDKPKLDQSYKGWEKALAAVKSGETTIEFLQNKYLIPDDCLLILKGIVNA